MKPIKIISLLAALLAAPLNALAEGTLLIKIYYSGGNYAVESVRHIEQTLPPMKNLSERAEDLIFRISNADDQILGQGRIDNPRKVRGLLNQSEHADHQGHQPYEDDKDGYLMLRYPHSDGMKFLELFEAAQADDKSGGSAAPAAKIDLSPFM